MVNKNVKINNPSGLQLDLAGSFCAMAMTFSSSIRFYYRGENQANAKSVLSILGAGIRSGEEIELECDGPDEKEALEALYELLSGKNN